jgi:hypothetical protein
LRQKPHIDAVSGARSIGEAPLTTLIPDARVALFGKLIDYAGLYPPASRDMEAAVAGYRAARASNEGWIANRFLCPASRLEGLAGELVATMQAGEEPWRIAVTFDLDAAASAAAAAAFHAEMMPAATVELAEVPIPPASDASTISGLFTAATSINDTVIPYLEVLRDGAMTATIGAIATVVAEAMRPGGAKLRCGGMAPEAFPTTNEVAEFIRACTETGLAFKTTAGLHHPIRHHDEELDVMRHGFLNLLAAAIAVREGAGPLTMDAIIADTDPNAFDVDFGGVTWRGERVGPQAVDETRREGFVAYGSCEFDEPVEDLARLGFLP